MSATPVNSAAPKPRVPSAPPGRGRSGKISFGERRELERLEGELGVLERRKTALSVALQAPGTDYAEVRRLADELAHIVAELENAESRWLTLAGRVEA